MKLYQTILIVLTILFLYEGFNGEFASPTIFDWIQVGSMAFLVRHIYHPIQEEQTMRLRELRTAKGLSVPKLTELSRVPGVLFKI